MKEVGMCVSKRCQPSSSLFSVFLGKSASHTCENLSGICRSLSYSLFILSTLQHPSWCPSWLLYDFKMKVTGLKTPSPKMFADAPVSSLGLEIFCSVSSADSRSGHTVCRLPGSAKPRESNGAVERNAC